MKKQHRRCAVCKRRKVRLYRYYNSFVMGDEVYCRSHSPAIEGRVLVPLFECEDGGAWGHTSAPDSAIQEWLARKEG